MRHLIIYRRVNRPRRNDKHSSSAGFTLIEVCIASALLILLTLALTQTVMVRMTSGELKARKQESRAVADNALEALAATSRTMLPDGVGSFTLAGDNSLNLTGDCSVLVCDYVLEPEAPASLKTSLARGVPWVKSYTPPSGYAIKFLRRWRTAAVPAPPGNTTTPSRALTLVVLTNEDAKLPLTVASTVAAPRL